MKACGITNKGQMKYFTSVLACSISNLPIIEGDEYHINNLSLYINLWSLNQIKESDSRHIINVEKEYLIIFSLFLETH
jgi:hypothetical protein